MNVRHILHNCTFEARGHPCSNPCANGGRHCVQWQYGTEEGSKGIHLHLGRQGRINDVARFIATFLWNAANTAFPRCRTLLFASKKANQRLSLLKNIPSSCASLVMQCTMNAWCDIIARAFQNCILSNALYGTQDKFLWDSHDKRNHDMEREEDV